ncbi:MAG: PrsW family intramembrane metalloprotease [Rubrobacteraceae bacterium]
MKFLGKTWFVMLAGGLLLLLLIEGVFILTNNPVYLPSTILLGAFLVPVVFTTYLYERLPVMEIPLPTMALCFVGGGVIGTATAGFLEYDVLSSLGSVPLLFVGFLEEVAKLVFPLFFYFAWRYRSEAAGIAIGVSTAMGFAAFETMGYAFTTVLHSREDLSALNEVLLERGLASPAAHAAWTGLVAAVLWRERLHSGRISFNAPVVGAFLIAVALHSLWDFLNFLSRPTPAASVALDLASLGVALASLALLILRIREAERNL